VNQADIDVRYAPQLVTSVLQIYYIRFRVVTTRKHSAVHLDLFVSFAALHFTCLIFSFEEDE